MHYDEQYDQEFDQEYETRETLPEKETEPETESKTELEALKEKYRSDGGRVYEVRNVIAIDDENEEIFTFLFRKPKPASYDRYIKTLRKSVGRASNALSLDCVVEEQRKLLEETLEEYPLMGTTFSEKLLNLLGLGDETSVKKL